MQTRLVYRMEADDGTGAFNAMPWPVYDRFAFLANLGDEETHPIPPSDAGLAPRLARGEIDFFWCACRSLTQLRQWFPRRTIPILLDGPISFTTWSVPRNRVAFGHKQVLFDRNVAECIERKSPTALYQ
jgi:hypothetical protein